MLNGIFSLFSYFLLNGVLCTVSDSIWEIYEYLHSEYASAKIFYYN